MKHSGTVIRKRVAAGSKSERDAVLLQTRDAEYVLRLQGGNPFHDPRLDDMVGKQIRADGDLHGATLIVRTWDEETGDGSAGTPA